MHGVTMKIPKLSYSYSNDLYVGLESVKGTL